MTINLREWYPDYYKADYNCVGVIDIPADLPLPAPAVSVNTRKGVTVCYSPNVMVANAVGA